MQNIMFAVFKNALIDYLKFLLGYSLRHGEIKNQEVVENLMYDPDIQLNLSGSAQKYKKGELINDVELIPLKQRPLLKVECLIEDTLQTQGNK